MRITFLLILLLISFIVFSQNNQTEVDLERLVDEIYGFQDLDLNYEDLYENLAQLLSNPLDLNAVTPEQLRSLYILSESQIQNLIAYKLENGALVSIYELQAIPGFDVQTIQKLLPFVKLNLSISNRPSPNSYFLIRYERTLETRKGFTSEVNEDSRFRGNQDRYYARYKNSRSGNYSFGFTAEKDIGEELIWRPANKQFGADHVSFHAQLLNKGKIKNLIIGDFQAQFGQGIALGSAFGFGKGGETILTTRKSNLGFIPYSSVTEFNFYRGIASTIELAKGFYVSSFFSSINKDANLASDSARENFISSFQTTGLHRNKNELETRKNLPEQNVGTVLHFQTIKLHGGLIYNQVKFDTPIMKRSNPYNQFTFSGTSNMNVGAFLNYTVNNFTLFSEFSQTIHQGNATIVGLLGSLSSSFDLAIHFRNYQRNYTSFYSNAFAEGSSTQNEQGIYWGWKYKLTKQITFNGYADLFKFPWLRYRSYTPSQGEEWLIRINYQPSKRTSVYVQLREEKKERNISDTDNHLFLTLPGNKRNFVLNVDYNITTSIKLRSRIQYSTYSLNQSTTNGILILQDINWRFNKFSITGRFAIFDTEDFDNRQYVYEHDVWLSYSLPAYNGVGIRNYIVAQYNISKSLSVWVRYSRFNYHNQTQIGSGVDTIEGNTRNDIKFQIRIKL